MISFGLPFAHRFGPATLRHLLVLAILALGVVMAFFYNQPPFDQKHQKRLFVIHMEDVSQFPFAVIVAYPSSFVRELLIVRVLYFIFSNDGLVLAIRIYTHLTFTDNLSTSS